MRMQNNKKEKNRFEDKLMTAGEVLDIQSNKMQTPHLHYPVTHADNRSYSTPPTSSSNAVNRKSVILLAEDEEQ